MNYLYLLNNPQLNSIVFFEVMKDFRKGGLNPEMFNDFIKQINKLPPIIERTPIDFLGFQKFNLKDISDVEFNIVLREVLRRSVENTKVCWHPEAGNTTCDMDSQGKIKISGAHSIQNNGILSRIAENGHVMGYSLDKVGFDGKEYGKNIASIFFGFCNKHDSIFYPIDRKSVV